MDHLAILSKKSKLLDKILSGEKTIESRWNIPRITPYENVSPGDTIYFKESGVPEVTAKATAKETLFFGDLTLSKIEKILQQYASSIGVGKSYAQEIKNRKYCTLVFLEDVQEIEPFKIDKTGYGTGCAWITVEDIKTIKL